ncbi:MAG: hypothetical protein QXJ74_01445 [Nitrososphaera sp.]
MNFNKVQKRRGIGTVITTLIVLIASVVLGAGVIFFGGSLFQTNTETEAVQVSNEHIWVATNGTNSVGAFVVQNTGGKVVSLQSISVRGQSVPTSAWWYNTADATAANIQRELTYGDGNLFNGQDVTGDATPDTFLKATGPISIQQGKAVIIYLDDPSGITSIDSGLSFNMNIQAGKASAVKSVSVVNG